MASREEAAAHVFLSTAHFDRLRREKAIVQPKGKGGYVLEDVRRSYIEHLRQAAKHPESEKPKAPDDYGAQIQRQKLVAIERQNAIDAGEYVPASLMREFGRKVGAQIQAMFEAFPGVIKTAIPHLRSSEVSIIKAALAKLARDICDIDPTRDTT